VGLLGPTVDPLGDELIRLLPEGLPALLAPAVALPALVLAEPAPAAPLMPVVVPLVVDPVAEAPPVEPPACAKAVLLAKASAAANPIVANLIDVSPRLRPSDEGQTAAPLYVPALAKTLNERPHGAGFRERKRLARPVEAHEAAEHRGESPPSLASRDRLGLACPAEAREASEGWWAVRGSNSRPMVCKTSALPLS
jgi:hypothetical protein